MFRECLSAKIDCLYLLRVLHEKINVTAHDVQTSVNSADGQNFLEGEVTKNAHYVCVMLVLVRFVDLDEVLVILRFGIDLEVLLKYKVMLLCSLGGKPKLNWRLLDLLHNLDCCL